VEKLDALKDSQKKQKERESSSVQQSALESIGANNISFSFLSKNEK